MFKLKIGFLFVNLFLFTAVFGQKWHFGPDLGGNFMSVEKDTFGTDFQPLFNGGGFVTYDFTNYFSLRSGAYFLQKRHTNLQEDTSLLNLFGFEDQIPAGANADLNVYTHTKSRVTQYYVEIPLLAVYKYDKFRAYLGPYIGYMVFARSKVETITEVPILQAVDISALDPSGTITAFLPKPYTYSFKTTSSKTGLNAWDFGLRGGFGLQSDRIGMNVFYNYGFLNYRDKVQIGENKPYNYFQASINYSFSCKKKN